MTLTTAVRKTALDEFLKEHLLDWERDVQHYAYSLPQNAMRFSASGELIRRADGHYFDESTLRTFKTHIHELYDGRFLIVSNRYGYPGARRHYRIVWLSLTDPTCANESHRRTVVSDLKTEFETLGKARTAAKRLAALTAQV
jgi:hypothetical protein